MSATPCCTPASARTSAASSTPGSAGQLRGRPPRAPARPALGVRGPRGGERVQPVPPPSRRLPRSSAATTLGPCCATRAGPGSTTPTTSSTSRWSRRACSSPAHRRALERPRPRSGSATTPGRWPSTWSTTACRPSPTRTAWRWTAARRSCLDPRATRSCSRAVVRMFARAVDRLGDLPELGRDALRQMMRASWSLTGPTATWPGGALAGAGLGAGRDGLRGRGGGGGAGVGRGAGRALPRPVGAGAAAAARRLRDRADRAVDRPRARARPGRRPAWPRPLRGGQRVLRADPRRAELADRGAGRARRRPGQIAGDTERGGPVRGRPSSPWCATTTRGSRSSACSRADFPTTCATTGLIALKGRGRAAPGTTCCRSGRTDQRRDSAGPVLQDAGAEVPCTGRP